MVYHAAKYQTTRPDMLRSLKRNLICLLAWLLLLPYSLLLFLLAYAPGVNRRGLYHLLARLWCKLYVRALRVELKLIRHNKRPIPKQYILVANHPSALEDFGIPALFDVYPLAKEGVRYWFFLGRVAESAGTIFVKRNDSLSRHLALESLLQGARDGKNLVIFPEGGCKGRRIYKRFHTGAFDVSLQTSVPILPVFLQYLDEDSFEWQGQTVPGILWQIFNARDHRVRYHLFDAIEPEGFTDKQQFADYVHEQYLQWEKEIIG